MIAFDSWLKIEKIDLHLPAGNASQDILMARVPQRRRAGSPPRTILIDPNELTEDDRSTLAERVTYVGNPAHKLNPGDYNLSPPRAPRQGKTLCDAKRALNLQEALGLLKCGINRAMLSSQRRGNWPQNIWAVDAYDEVFEAQLHNQETGEYHGYPISSEDDWGHFIASEWLKRANLAKD